jgi:hypothetical protein
MALTKGLKNQTGRAALKFKSVLRVLIDNTYGLLVSDIIKKMNVNTLNSRETECFHTHGNILDSIAQRQLKEFRYSVAGIEDLGTVVMIRVATHSK